MENKDKEEITIKENEVNVDDKIIQIMLDASELSLEDFHSNDKKVLSVLNQDSDVIDSQYTFNGLVRKLGIHQQSLTRSLHRLEDAGLVQKTDFGYKLARNIPSMLTNNSKIDSRNPSRKISSKSSQFEKIIQFYIPSNIKVEDVVKRLQGKWFGSLRWLGLISGEDGHILQWAIEDKYQVNLKIISRYALVESNAIVDKDKSESILDAYGILEQMTKLLRENEEKVIGKNNFLFGPYN